VLCLKEATTGCLVAGPHGSVQQEVPPVQLFQQEARTPPPPAAAADDQEQNGASPAAQAILSAISGGTKAPSQQQQPQVGTRLGYAADCCVLLCPFGASMLPQQPA
jgi:hypothetical protein